MLSETELPSEAHIAALKRDEAIRRALDHASERTLSRSGVWAAYLTAALIFGGVYAATKDPFVALASGVSVGAMNIAVTTYLAARKMQGALLALIEVVRDKEKGKRDL
jgi:hypothetical protein